MDTFLVVLSLLSVLVVIYMLVKKMDIKISLLAMGIILMYIAVLMGKPISIGGFDLEKTGLFLAPIFAIVDQFKSTLNGAGFILLILGGYTGYMNYIGANELTVNALLKPIKKIKAIYLLIPVVFLFGNFLSLVIPSASNLAIILLATLYPVLRSAGLSNLTVAGIIATTATVMPTPLGGDNVAVAAELAKTQEFLGLTVTGYVFKYHALVSVPTLMVMALVHYFWQQHMDKRQAGVVEGKAEEKTQKSSTDLKGFMRLLYILLPLLPILLLLVSFFYGRLANVPVKLTVETVSILSFIIAIFLELIHKGKGIEVLAGTDHFFKGMGNSMGTLALLVAASIYVVGLKSMGLISFLQGSMEAMKDSNMGFVLPLILVVFTIVIVLVSGSGTALFYAMVPLMVPLAIAAGISPLAISVPMGLAGNLMRAVSPVAAVVMIVAGTVKEEPLDIVKRTSVPMVVGLVFMFLLSMIVFL